MITFATYYRNENYKMTIEEKQHKFLELLEPVLGNLNSFVFSLTYNKSIAEDIISQTILIAFEQLEKLKNEKAFLSYLFTIASRCYSQFKRQSKLDYFESDVLDQSYFSNDINSEEITDMNILLDLIKKIPENLGSVFILHELFDFSLKEISEILNISIVNSKVRLHRAKKLLKNILSKNY